MVFVPWSIKYMDIKASSLNLVGTPALAVQALNACRGGHVQDMCAASNEAVHLIITGVEALSIALYILLIISAKGPGHW